MRREIFKHFKRGDRPSAAEYNRLVDAVTKHSSSLHAQGFVDSSGYHTRRLPSEAAVEPPLVGKVIIRCRVTGTLYEPVTVIRSVKIQAGGVPGNNTGPFTCKLLDSQGVETGSDISVLPQEHLGSNFFNSTDIHPSYTAGDYITVLKDLNDLWYTVEVFEDTIDSVRTAP